MLAIQMRCRPKAKKELTSIRVLTRIRHAQDSWSVVFVQEILISKRLAIDTSPAGAVAIRKITALGHEATNNAMKRTIQKALVCFWVLPAPRMSWMFVYEIQSLLYLYAIQLRAEP